MTSANQKLAKASATVIKTCKSAFMAVARPVGRVINPVFNAVANVIGHKKIATKLQIGLLFGALVSSGGAVYHLDRSHAHGFSNPYHATQDAVYKAGKATAAQKEILVKAAVQSGQDMVRSNYYGGAAFLAVMGLWTVGAARQRIKPMPRGGNIPGK